MSRVGAFALAVVSVLAVCACGSGPSADSRAKSSDPLALSTYRGAGGIVVREPGGSWHRLTRNSGDIFPAWSRDGKRIAFERKSIVGSRLFGAFVYVMSADGGRARQVPGVLADAESLGWGPGGRIVFGNGKGISVVNPDGSGLKQLVANASEPAWSPDGRTILFVRPPPSSATLDQSQLFAMRADGTDVHPFLKSRPPRLSSFCEATWAPDGKHVAFLETPNLSTSLDVANADGSNQKTLTKVSAPIPPDDVRPTWSSDSGSLAFMNAEPTNGIWVISAGGGKPDLLIKGGAYSQPNWRARR